MALVPALIALFYYLPQELDAGFPSEMAIIRAGGIALLVFIIFLVLLERMVKK